LERFPQKWKPVLRQESAPDMQRTIFRAVARPMRNSKMVQNPLGFPRATRQKARVSFLRRPLALMIPLLALSLTLSGSSTAQLDGTDRGIDPYDSASNFEVGGVQVDVRAASGEAARSEGWRRAQILGWRILWARTHNRPIEQA